MATVTGGPLEGQDDSVGREALDADRALLEALEPKMRKALALRQAGDEAAAVKLLRAILADEPRLAEPRLELAHLAVVAEAWEEAREQAAMAVEILRAGGQWILDLPPETLLSFALNLLGETVVRPLEEGDLFLVDREAFTTAWNGAAALFEEATKLDPDNEEARRNHTRYRALPG
jgi:hypothetical protein